MDAQNQAIKAIEKLLGERLKSEVIGGTSIADCLDMVELDIAYSPVIPYCCDDPLAVPDAYEVRPTQGGNNYIVMADPPISVPASALKVMRCRYLLWNNFSMRTYGSYIVPARSNKPDLR